MEVNMFLRLKKAVFLAFCLPLAMSLPGCKNKTPSIESALEVSTLTVHPERTSRWIDTFGETSGTDQIDIRPQVSGILKAFYFREGSAVNKGDLLFEIEKEPYEAALEKAKAELAQAQAELARAQKDFERNSRLLRSAAVSQSVFDASQSAYLGAKANCQAAAAGVTSAQNDLSHALIKSPVDGVIGKSEVNAGGLVSASSTLLARITQPSDLRVDFAISDKDFVRSRVAPGNRVEVLSKDSDMSVPARLDYIASQINSENATVRLRAVLDDSKGFWPGMYVSVRLEAEKLSGVFRVPQKAVKQKTDGSYAVYVLKNGKAHEMKVSLSHWEGADWIVTSGLHDGDEVIYDQMLRLRDGLAVTRADSGK